MKSENPNIFECMDCLDKYKEWDFQYKYYSEVLKNRKKMLNLFWNPYFQEIRNDTKAIQNILKKNWYKDIDLQLKALFIDGIEYFLWLESKDKTNDNKKYLYLMWLFDSLKINMNNKNLLNEILSELKTWWENLPDSPIEVLVNYDYNKRSEVKDIEQKINNKIIKKVTPEKDILNRVIQDFWEKDYGFIKDLRTVWVEEERLEYTFLVWLYDDIVKLVNGEAIDERKIDRIFNYYSIDTSDKQLLLSLKDKIENRFTEFSSKDERVKKISISEKAQEMIDEISRELYKSRFANKRLEWKIAINWHCAFDDSPQWLELFGENVVKYEIWDEYVPISNSCVWEIWKINPDKNPDFSFDMLSSYRNWDRFTVVEPTYSEYIKYDRDMIKCWFINVRSKKTWKIYRALSE